jgi:hypothetical protein
MADDVVADQLVCAVQLLNCFLDLVRAVACLLASLDVDTS